MEAPLMRLPEFLTFTGVDNWTDIEALQALSNEYPIEWAMLFSPAHQGINPRYPADDAQSALWSSGLNFAAHLCGRHSRRAMEGANPELPVDLSYCRRVQLNHEAPDPIQMMKFAANRGEFQCIGQSRSVDSFPQDVRVDWLFDGSGGRGIRPARWPSHPGGQRLVGYAGGITPGNIRSTIQAIHSEGRYWLDMETGIRTNNKLDLALCREVCQEVYD
jgi:hypothetical protein